MTNSLRILLWNCNGLVQHKDELEIFLQSNKIDIALISEAHFTERTYFSVKNYQLYTTLHPTGNAHGGTAILIKPSIRHHECTPYCWYKIQATTIKVETQHHTITLSAVYCPPRFSIRPTEYQHFFATLGPRFVAGADWNAKHTYWGSSLTTTRGRNLYEATRSGSFNNLATGQPTYWPSDPHKIPDLLDFFITHGLSDNYTSVESNLDLSSDHSPLILTLSTTVISKPPSISLTTPQTNWDEFKNYLTENINLNKTLKSTEDIDYAVDYATNLIQKAAQHAKPPTEKKNNTNVNIPREIADMITEKRRMRRIWQNTRNPLHKNILNRLTRKLQTSLKKRNNEMFEDYLVNLNTEDGSLWKTTKKFKRPIQRVPHSGKKTIHGLKKMKRKLNCLLTTWLMCSNHSLPHLTLTHRNKKK